MDAVGIRALDLGLKVEVCRALGQANSKVLVGHRALHGGADGLL
jgi:hypothetical protein